MKITQAEQISSFQTSSSNKAVEALRKKLVKVCSTNSDSALAAARSYDIFYKTEIKELTMDTWEEISLTDYTNAAGIADIVSAFDLVKKNIITAISEIKEYLPIETYKLLKEYASDQNPIIKIALSVYIISIDRMQGLL